MNFAHACLHTLSVAPSVAGDVCADGVFRPRLLVGPYLLYVRVISEQLVADDDDLLGRVYLRTSRAALTTLPT